MYVIDFMGRAVGSTVRAQRHVLAVITPCVTNGLDAREERVTYTDMGPLCVIDVNAVGSVIGRFEFGFTGHQQWAILDRSTALASAVFVDEHEELVDQWESL